MIQTTVNAKQRDRNFFSQMFVHRVKIHFELRSIEKRWEEERYNIYPFHNIYLPKPYCVQNANVERIFLCVRENEPGSHMLIWALAIGMRQFFEMKYWTFGADYVTSNRLCRYFTAIQEITMNEKEERHNSSDEMVQTSSNQIKSSFSACIPHYQLKAIFITYLSSLKHVPCSFRNRNDINETIKLEN